MLTERQGQIWFAKLRFGNFDHENAPRPESPLEVDVYKIKSLVHTNRRMPTREIAEDKICLTPPFTLHNKKIVFESHKKKTKRNYFVNDPIFW